VLGVRHEHVMLRDSLENPGQVGSADTLFAGYGDIDPANSGVWEAKMPSPWRRVGQSSSRAILSLSSLWNKLGVP
jgi:hypothetical protein